MLLINICSPRLCQYFGMYYTLVNEKERKKYNLCCKQGRRQGGGLKPPPLNQKKTRKKKQRKTERKRKRGIKKRKEVEPVIPRTYVVMGLQWPPDPWQLLGPGAACSSVVSILDKSEVKRSHIHPSFPQWPPDPRS